MTDRRTWSSSASRVRRSRNAWPRITGVLALASCPQRPKFTRNPKFAFKPDWDALRTFNSRLESIPVPVAYQSRCMAWNAPIPFLRAWVGETVKRVLGNSPRKLACAVLTMTKCVGHLPGARSATPTEQGGCSVRVTHSRGRGYPRGVHQSGENATASGSTPLLRPAVPQGDGEPQ